MRSACSARFGAWLVIAMAVLLRCARAASSFAPFLGSSARGRLRAVLGTLVAALVMAVVATPANAFVYWTNYSASAIGRANLDGTGVDQSFITGASAFGPYGVAVDGQHIYWANSNTNVIGRANVDGSGVDQSFITGVFYSVGVAVDGQHIYWANYNAGAIGRANLDGTDVNQSFIRTPSLPNGVAVDGQHVYWTNSYAGGLYGVGRANLDGSGVDQSFITMATGPSGVAVDGQHIYWANTSGNTIGRANLDGTDVDQSSIGGASGPWGVAVDTLRPAPVVSGVSPSEGSEAGGTSVRITGSNFAGANAVSFGGTPAASFTVNSAVQITATSPAGAGTVDVTVTTPGGTSATNSADHYTYTTSPSPSTNTSPPAISGIPTVGQTLACQPGTWTGSPTYSYQWYRDGVPITGAMGQTYTVQAADQGHTLTCAVTATDAGGSATATSAGVQILAAAEAAPKCTIASTGQVTITRPKTRGQSSANGKPSAATGTLAVKVTCDQAAKIKLTSVLIDKTTKAKGHHGTKTKRYQLATVNASIRAGVTTVLKLKLPASVCDDLLHGAKQTLGQTLTATSGNGTSHTTSTIGPLTH
jgi:virginiamycin B lyase